MRCHIEVEVNNKKEEFEIGYVAKQTSGSVMMKIGGTVMIVSDNKNRQTEYSHPATS